MPETLQKLSPDRDLQCYFQRPSAIAALSGASPSGFTVSGTWRQQFDWAVIEWNRDNVFEHPAFRSLPDGEVLYSVDVNNTALNRVINYPRADWTPAALTCLKTESFTYTYSRDLDSSMTSIEAGSSSGFPPSQRSHLVGISDSSTSWLKEARMAEASGFESVVLFALDQFCLIGYQLPLSTGMRRSVQLG